MKLSKLWLYGAGNQRINVMASKTVHQKHIRAMPPVYTIINFHPKRIKGNCVVVRPSQPHKIAPLQNLSTDQEERATD